MSSTYQAPSPSSPRRLSALFASPRRRAATLAVVVIVIAGVTLAVADPFGTTSPSGAGVIDNSYPTSTTTVTERDLSSQTSVNATLGYAGSYTVALPNGTSASTVSAAQSSVQSAASKVAADETALGAAKATATPTNASTLLSARATVTSDENALKIARAQLASDLRLNCPASSSDTVTTALGGSAGTDSGNSSSDTSAPTATTIPSGGSATSTAGTTGNGRAHVRASVIEDAATTTGNAASAPTASTGTVNQTSNTATEVTGSVNPNGDDTVYSFQYGTSPNYGEATTSTDAGSGTNDVVITSSLTGLTPGATYHYRLVATNAVGTTYGQDQTFATSAAPVATTGAATPVSATSASLAGSVDPDGSDTSYYFEWGTSASLENKTPIVDAGAGTSAITETTTITGLQAGSTYEFALVATSSLGTSTGAVVTFQAAESSCVAERHVIAEDGQSLSEAKNTLSLDELNENSSVASAAATLSSDQTSLTTAEQALAADQSQVTNSDTTFTALPSVGKIITRGMRVYALDNEPVPLLYGATPFYRALHFGVSPGPDVAELQANLIALGFGSGISADEDFSAATESDVKAWQRSLGLAAMGIVALGDVVVESGPIEVDTVSVSVGAAAAAGSSVLTATSTSRVVSISLDADQQSEVKVGDPVTVTLPDNSTTPGVVSSVGTVATAPPSSGGTTGSGSGPTIAVEVTLTNPKAAGDLDAAPVTVSITNASVTNALVVPVDALLALANGGYAVEEVESSGLHQLIPVTLGLFDDADGLVQVSGSDIAAGQKIVVPNT